MSTKESERQCPFFVTFKTGDIFYCVENEGHKEHHRPDPDAWRYVTTQGMWQRPSRRTSSEEDK